MSTPKNKQWRNLISLSLLALIVFLSRLPFLFNGYGVEEDSWGLVINTWDIIKSEHYVYSRLPGHPVQEIVLTLFNDSGVFFFNLFSAIFSTVAVIYFARILKWYGFRYYFVAALALAFTPVFYISSTYTIDYCWTLAFIMMSFFYILDKKFLISGVLLGLAVGCRLTAALLLFPFLIIICELPPSSRWKAMIKLSVSAAVAGIIVYLPALIEYGLEVIATYKLPYPPLAKVSYKASLGVWGLAGLAALLWAIIVMLNKRKKKSVEIFPLSPNKYHVAGWITAIVLSCLIFVRLPEKSAFMIPALPFIILIIARYIKSKKAFFIFCGLTIISPFIFSVNLTDKYRGSEYSSLSVRTVISGQEVFFDPVSGPILSDYWKRKNKQQFTSDVVNRFNSIKKPSLILAGWWYNEIMVQLHKNPQSENIIIVEYANEEHLKHAKTKGYAIYYLPEIDFINDKRYDGEFTSKYAEEFQALETVNDGEREFD